MKENLYEYSINKYAKRLFQIILRKKKPTSMATRFTPYDLKLLHRYR